MKNVWAKGLAVVCILISTGCASLIDGRRESVSFSSDPPGAQIIINGKPMGVTPTSIVLERSEYGSANVVFKKDGYEDQRATIVTSVNNWFWGNILFGGLIGSSTDAATGAMWKFAPNSYYASMPPLKASNAEWDRFVYERTRRRFLLFSYSQLVSDVVTGHGEYLSSLYQIFSVPANQRRETLANLENIVFSSENAPAFTNAVVKEFEHGSIYVNARP
jgi:hypothetical protein